MAAVAVEAAVAAADAGRCRTPEHSRRVPRSARRDHRRTDRAAAEEVPRGRRNDRRRRAIDGARPPAGAADREPSGRAERRRRGAAAQPRQVLRPRIGAAGGGRPAAIRSPPACPITLDVFFDNSPVYRPGAGRERSRASGRSPGSIRRRRCEAAGPRGRATSTAAWSPSMRRSARAGCSSSRRRSPSAASRMARSSSSSTGSIWPGIAAEGRSWRENAEGLRVLQRSSRLAWRRLSGVSWQSSSGGGLLVGFFRAWLSPCGRRRA